jgi:hypothetical protein
VNGDHLTSCLTLQDYFIMNVEKNNVEAVDFYILMCTIPIQSPYTCAWGQQFEASDTIMVGV